jgi:hypothetical protein
LKDAKDQALVSEQQGKPLGNKTVTVRPTQRADIQSHTYCKHATVAEPHIQAEPNNTDQAAVPAQVEATLVMA